MSKSKTPLLSIVIPAYNEEAYIIDCLTSLLKQDFKKSEYEIIVVNNASTDKTDEVVKRFPVKLVYEPIRSVVLARQKGVNSSKGKIIVSADADTTYPPNWLLRISKVFKNKPEIIAVVGWLYFKNSTTFFNLGFAINQELNAFIKKLTGKFPLVFAANFAFKKNALKKIGGYPTHLPELGDQQYLLFKFQKLGSVAIDKKMYCVTSGRKHHSKTKNILIYNGWYRLMGFLVNSLLGRQIIGPAPAIRKASSTKETFPHSKKS